MAGFFGLFNYSKPGKGIDKNAPQKHRFLVFFELLFRKLFKLIELNLMYFFIIFPVLAFLTLYICASFGIEADTLSGDLLITVFASFMYGLPKIIVWILIGASAILFGPATAGMTYIIRNYVKQEHAWILSDFFDRIKQNFKQGLIAGFLDIVILMSFVIYITTPLGDTTAGQYLSILKYVAVVVFAIYEIMRFYIYTIMVTFDMKFVAILRNSWLFVILGVVKNLIIIFFCGLVILGSLLFFDFIFVPLITFSLCGFIVVFNAYPTVKKFMLDPLTERDEDSEVDIEYEEENNDEPVFEDDVALRHKDENKSNEEK